MECQEAADGLGEVGGDANKRRGGPQSGRNVLKGGDTGATPTWLVYLGHIGVDEEYGGGKA